MRIWIDNDGCPRVVREIVCAAAQRRGLRVQVVGNSMVRLPPGAPATMVVVDGGFDAADNHIADHAQKGDLVITSDIPLAARVVASGAIGLSSRGEEFDAANVGERLAVRNLLAELRSAGDVYGGPPAFDQADRARFANALDRILTRLLKA